MELGTSVVNGGGIGSRLAFLSAPMPVNDVDITSDAKTFEWLALAEDAKALRILGSFSFSGTGLNWRVFVSATILSFIERISYAGLNSFSSPSRSFSSSPPSEPNRLGAD